jgi:hypothetical protein
VEYFMREIGTISLEVVLTDDVQVDEVAHMWRRADLALVYA